MPTRTSADVEARVLQMRRRERIGRDQIAHELGVPPRTVSRIVPPSGAAPDRLRPDDR